MNTNKKREIMAKNNNFMLLYGFAFVISGLRRIQFDITSHQKQKKNKKYMLLLLKKYCELSCCTMTKANSYKVELSAQVSDFLIYFYLFIFFFFVCVQ